MPLDVIAEGPFRPKNNLVAVPEGPGLGVTLDRARLDHCHELFRDDRPYEEFRDAERSGVHRRLPLR